MHFDKIKLVTEQHSLKLLCLFSFLLLTAYSLTLHRIGAKIFLIYVKCNRRYFEMTVPFFSTLRPLASIGYKALRLPADYAHVVRLSSTHLSSLFEL